MGGLDFSAADVARATGGKLLSGAGEQRISGVTIDSRQVKPGDMFVALKGERVDGHQFIPEAVARGAVAVLLEREIFPPGTVALLKVPDCREALLDLAAWHRRRFSLVTVGITGSTGKTTTKEMVAAVLAQSFSVHKNRGNYNTEIGVPLTLFELEPDHEIAVLEMGMRGREQIRRLAQVAAPKIGVITNIGLTHLELLGTVENIARAKWELVEELPPAGIAVLNGDDERLRQLSRSFKGRVFFYGLGVENDFRAVEMESRKDGSISFTACTPAGEGRIQLPLPGRHNVVNALAALAAGAALGMSLPEMARGLAAMEPAAMRLNIVKNKAGVTIINDAYNANPTSMESGLLTLMDLKGEGRAVAVLGDMLELGPAASKAHWEVGEKAARLGLDLLVALGEWRETVLAGAREGGLPGEKTRAFSDKDEAAAFLKDWLQAGDLVLVKASRGLQLEDIVAELLDQGN